MAKVPFSGLLHNDVPLYAGQSDACVQKARDDIDLVSEMTDIDDLVRCCRDRSWAAESRLWALARLQAQWAQVVEERRVRPDIDIEAAEAATAHLNTEWHDIVERWPPKEPDGEDPIPR